MFKLTIIYFYRPTKNTLKIGALPFAQIAPLCPQILSNFERMSITNRMNRLSNRVHEKHIREKSKKSYRKIKTSRSMIFFKVPSTAVTNIRSPSFAAINPVRDVPRLGSMCISTFPLFVSNMLMAPISSNAIMFRSLLDQTIDCT